MRIIRGEANRRRASAIAVVALVGGSVIARGGVAAAVLRAPTFAEKVDFATGGGSTAVVLGDLNGDAHLDLMTADRSSHEVSVRLGDGAGGFGARTSFPTGVNPVRLATGDLNADGSLDVVTANINDASVSVLLGDGTGALGIRTDFATGNGPISVAVGDMNGDTHLDLVTANVYAFTTSVLLGDGTGAFGAKTDVGVVAEPYWAALGDLDGDTNLDLAVPSGSGAEVVVRLGDGTGGFRTRTSYAVAAHPLSATLADLNGDGDLDLVTPSEAAVSVLMGDGAGGFAPRVDFPTRNGGGDVMVADMNGDALPDLVTPDYIADKVSLLLGDGTGGFSTRVTQPTGHGPTSSAVGDLNGDTMLDIVVTNTSADTVSVLVNTTPAVPSAPRLAMATTGDGQATVSWQPPAYQGAAAITGYVVTPYVGFSPRPSQTFVSTGTTQTVIGLTNGTTYRFRVQAINAVGTSGYSTVTNPVTPAATVPGAPTIIRNATAGNGEATVSWTAPASDGGAAVTGYVVTPYVGYSPRPSTTFGSTDTTQTVIGLTNGTTYRFRVQAINAVGTSGFSTVTNPVTPTA